MSYRRLATVLVSVIATLCTACRNENASGLKSNESSIDFGIVYDREVSHEFTLRNSSQQPIRIKSIGRSCTCLAPEMSREEIPPGSTATLLMKASINQAVPWKEVKFTHKMWLRHNASDDPLVFFISGIYVPPIHFEEDQAVVNTDVDRAIDSTLLFAVRNVTPQMNPKVAVPSLPWLSSTITTPDVDRGNFQLELKGSVPESVDLFPIRASIELTFDAVRYDIPLVINGKGFGRISQFPDRLACGVLKTGEPFSGSLRASWPIGSNLRVSSVTASSDQIQLTHQTYDEGKLSHIAIVCEILPTTMTSLNQEVIELVLSDGVRRRKVAWPVSGVVTSHE